MIMSLSGLRSITLMKLFPGFMQSATPGFITSVRRPTSEALEDSGPLGSDWTPVAPRCKQFAMIEKIISGGQTGADCAALDFAIEHGIPHGGWCPGGRLAEDGPIDARYQLKETPSANYTQRTEWNVRDSDGTVVFSI